MRRREFITLLGGAAITCSVSAWAEQSGKPIIGFLNGGSPDGYARMATAFRQGLKEVGFVEGQNVLIEYRWAEGKFDTLPALIRELVDRQVTVIAATTTPAALATIAATTTIPVVFTTSNDPVLLKLVGSLSRPGGNVTGATQMNVEVAPKRLELLRALIPAATDVGLLINPTNPTAEAQASEMQVAARALGLKLHILHAGTERDVDAAFGSLLQLQASGLVISSADPFFTSQTKRLAALALRHAVPTIYQYREFVAAGGLMSYGGSIAESYRLAGEYTGRILKGEKPGDLPVQQTTKLELIINLKTAKALGLTVPLSLLGGADEVIE